MTRVLKDRDAGLYLAAVVVSGFGSSALGLVAGIWTKDLTGSNALAALCLFALWAPTLAGPLLGTLADRVRRRPLLIGTNLGLAALVLALLAVDSPAGVGLLLAVLLVYGAVGVVQDAAESALLTSVVGPTLLGDYNGLRMTANEGMKLLAPLTGAGLYAAYGGPWVALPAAVTFAVAAALLTLLRMREPVPVPPEGVWRERAAEGARHMWARPMLRLLVLCAGATMLCAGVNGALIYAVVDRLGRSPAYTGVLYVAQGAGSVTVGLVTGPLLRRLGECRFAAYGIALTACAVALRAGPHDAVALVCSAAVGAGLPCVLIAALTAVQRGTPGHLLGRTAATATTLMYAPNAVGLAVGAALVAHVDVRVLLVAVGVVCLLPVPWLVARHRRQGVSGGLGGSGGPGGPGD
ncbi:MFS transporter [Streptomyces poonensis]|uniref:MFS transporter n=1 Tax=Streptomyces poonensis TaxID=68255 RepID=A0A918Q5M5_9ACTN|nr:MFS transporter [Streptomyces poonensis]GLJ89194.1 MFS transporter [Streptomyces poonensis]